VVTQQRHKVYLDQVRKFEAKPIYDPELKQVNPKNNVISCLFSHINPFSQYVIQDIFEDEHLGRSSEETKEPEGKKDERIWNLQEELFKKDPNHQVNLEHLIKSSSQMFSVYKYYESPSLMVKSQYYN